MATSILERLFTLNDRKTTVRTEFIAGMTTFFAMAYILLVNPNMFSNPFGNGTNVIGVSFGAIYIATAISAVFGTLLIGLLANLPLAQASGMGLNAFFIYTACIGFGFTYANALVMILFDGILFVVLTVTGIRKKIFWAIPGNIRPAIGVGLGLFIAFLGFQTSGVVIPNQATGVSLASFNLISGDWAKTMPLIVMLFTFFTIVILQIKKVTGAVLLGMIIGTLVYYGVGSVSIPGFVEKMISFNVTNPWVAMNEFTTQSFMAVVSSGFDFTGFIAKHGEMNFVFTLISLSLAFCLLDMFDTLGTLYATCSAGNLLTKEGEIPKMEKAMLSDAVATVAGAFCGSSTVTTFVESSTGIVAGGRTGLTSVFTAMFFFIAIFLSPLAQFIPSCATGAALVYVGVPMMASVREIDWTMPQTAVPAFLTIVMMPFSYNISIGIAFGLISYIIIEVAQGRGSHVRGWTWIIVALFAAMLITTH